MTKERRKDEEIFLSSLAKHVNKNSVDDEYGTNPQEKAGTKWRKQEKAEVNLFEYSQNKKEKAWNYFKISGFEIKKTIHSDKDKFEHSFRFQSLKLCSKYLHNFIRTFAL